MWAQLIKMRIKPGKDDDMAQFRAKLKAMEQPGSGLIRVLSLQDQTDPSVLYMLPIFESEEKARERERDPRRREGLAPFESMMQDALSGPAEFTDLAVIEEFVPG